ncbi:hypothetical protein SAMN05216388_100477 [Halorientalis persicus]|jgi:hypothetical protein|uniref:Uncharacterized protein n=1 Tax=Halorientalis persicus TaxID=1367881 RepID=A0A1H8I648_9EURY|nr:hypothetical protein [Halorientalis persicus]SEN63771.1 hypothetical protein SAMN05216388_100477 [Halorientalis persicus]
MATSTPEREVTEAAQKTGTDPWVIAAGASVILSWYEFFLRDNKEMGLFVGLWPPTFLAFASYFEQRRMGSVLDRITGRSGVIDSVERMIQNR